MMDNGVKCKTTEVMGFKELTNDTNCDNSQILDAAISKYYIPLYINYTFGHLIVRISSLLGLLNPQCKQYILFIS